MAKKRNVFGTACRQLRASRSKTMADQAADLGYSVSFISQVETGRRRPPPDYVARFAEWLQLPKNIEQALERLADTACKSIRVDPKDEDRAALVNQFARTVNVISDEQVLKFQSLLEIATTTRYHPEAELNKLAMLLRDLIDPNDLLRVIETLLTRSNPDAHIRILSATDEHGDLRGYSTRRKSDLPHIALSEEVYLGASQNRPDGRRTLMEELAHFILHDRKLAGDGGKHSSARWRVEREADLFVQTFFMPRSVARRFESPEQARRLLRLPLFFTQDCMKRHGLWKPPAPVEARRELSLLR